MSKQKVLYISQEITPYLKPTALGQLCQTIPAKVQEKGFEVRTFMPKYGSINERRNQLHEVIRLSGINLVIDDADHPLIIKVATLQAARMQVYFIDNDDYFQHHNMAELEIRATPEDNDERMMFFVRGVMETVRKLRWEPAIIHCTGWITSLAPLYVKAQYAEDPTIGKSKIIYTLADDNFEGTLNARFVEKLQLDGIAPEQIEILGNNPVDYFTLNKLAIANADGIMIASANVPAELTEYARSLGKPIIEINGDEPDHQAIADFYNSL